MPTAETKDELPKSAGRWHAALKMAGKCQEKWEQRAEKILKRYRDERNSDVDGSKRFNILWSNVETLKPALYASTPRPQVSRRYKDADPLGRQAAMVMERALEFSVDSYDFDEVMRSAVEDRLLPGRGVARVAYKPTMGRATDMDGNPFEEVVYEEAVCEYWYWRDFRHGPGRSWEKVPWVAFATMMSRDELKERFGEIGAKVPLNSKPEDADESLEEEFKQARVWEIWDKRSKQVHWVADDFDVMLESGEPPLNLNGFFPCPRPLFSTTTNDNLIPVPDFTEYQDQADELDELTARIHALVCALKVAGVYAADAPELSRLLDEGAENQMIPVDNWAMFAERGGLAGMVSWFPIEQVIKVVLGLYDARDRTKQEMYEITGLSDIIRGASVAQETATAQRIKGQFATLRLGDSQKQVATFARDLLRLKAEVVAEHFAPQTLQLMTGLEVNEETMALLRNDALRSFRIDIETDSTIQPDEQADKEARVEFLNTASSFLERAIPAFQQMPELGPLMGQMLMFGIRGFRAGRELEEAFEQSMEAIGQRQQQQGQEQQPDPAAMAKAQEAQQKMQIEQQKAQMDMQAKQQQQAIDMQKGQTELRHMEQDQAVDMQKAALSLEAQQRKLERQAVQEAFTAPFRGN